MSPGPPSPVQPMLFPLMKKSLRARPKPRLAHAAFEETRIKSLEGREEPGGPKAPESQCQGRHPKPAFYRLPGDLEGHPNAHGSSTASRPAYWGALPHSGQGQKGTGVKPQLPRSLHRTQACGARSIKPKPLGISPSANICRSLLHAENRENRDAGGSGRISQGLDGKRLLAAIRGPPCDLPRAWALLQCCLLV